MAVATRPVRPQYVSPADAAYQLGYCRETIYSMVRAGELPATRIRNRWRIPADALTELVEKGRV